MKKSKSEYMKIWRQNNKDYYKTYYAENSNKWKNYYEENKTDLKTKSKLYYEVNSEILKSKRTSKLTDEYRKYQNTYTKTKRSLDINYRLRHNLRARLTRAIKNAQKSGSAIKDMGCSIEELKTHLESKFQNKMTWDNYGEWEIDHIKPLSSFDLSKREELLKACNFNNLQPLWKADHSIKTAEDLQFKIKGVL